MKVTDRDMIPDVQLLSLTFHVLPQQEYDEHLHHPVGLVANGNDYNISEKERLRSASERVNHSRSGDKDYIPSVIRLLRCLRE